MSQTPQVPAGWYPDPEGSPRSRWWDGTQWTAHFQEPYSAGAAQAALRAPEGTKAYNVWIWLAVIVPYVTLPLLFLLDFGSMFDVSAMDDPYEMTRLQAEFMFSPAVIALTLGGYLTAGLSVLFSYFDWKTLRDAGVPRPFHWAFAFLNFVIGPVYAIGRAVVVKRRTGHGSAVLWVTIALLVLTVLVAIIWAVSLVNGLMMEIMSDPSLYR